MSEKCQPEGRARLHSLRKDSEFCVETGLAPVWHVEKLMVREMAWNLHYFISINQLVPPPPSPLV
jgi:hypothetical protein